MTIRGTDGMLEFNGVRVPFTSLKITTWQPDPDLEERLRAQEAHFRRLRELNRPQYDMVPVCYVPLRLINAKD